VRVRVNGNGRDGGSISGSEEKETADGADKQSSNICVNLRASAVKKV